MQMKNQSCADINSDVEKIKATADALAEYLILKRIYKKNRRGLAWGLRQTHPSIVKAYIASCDEGFLKATIWM
jgi:hypothetical protein